MEIPRWPRTFICVLTIAGFFLQASGNSGPKWSNQVETHILSTLTGATDKIDAKVYYDKEANKLAVLWRTVTPEREQTEEQLLVYRFDKEAGLLISGHKCDTAPKIERNVKAIQFLEVGENGSKTLKDFGSLLFFDPVNHAKEVPFNREEPFPIETKKWESNFVNMEDFGLEYCNLTHYITTKTSEEMPGDSFSSLLKIKAACSAEEQKILYEVDVLWSKNAISSAEIFQQPPGVYCPFVNTSRSFPSMPAYFSFDFVTFDSDQELDKTAYVTRFSTRVWFDSSRKLVRKDNLNSEFGIETTMIGDHNSRLSYIIMSSGECSIIKLKPSDTMEGGVALPGENFPLFPGSPAYSPQYIGQRKRYGITFDVWTNRNVNDETIEISDYYFTSDVHTDDNSSISSPAFIQLFIFNQNEELVGSGLQLIGHYRTTPNVEDQSTFDVTACFPETNKARFLLTFEGNVSSVNPIGLRDKLRKELLSSLNIDDMRLGAVEVAFINDSSMVFSSVIVEDPTSSVYREGSVSTTIKESLNALSELVNRTELQITAKSKDSPPKEVVLTANKLKLGFPIESGEDYNDKDTNTDKKKKKPPGFSSGALAGVGIAMLVVGMIQGIILLVVYMRYKNDDTILRKLTGSQQIRA